MNERPRNGTDSELQELRKDIDDLKRKLPDRLTRVGAIAGIFAAVVSVLLGANDLYKRLTKMPQLSVTAGRSLETAYSPVDKTFALQFVISLANYGDLPNIIDDISAEITSDHPSHIYKIFVSAPDFHCSSGSIPVPVPFPVPAGPASTLECTAQTSIPDSMRPQVVRENNKFTILFRGQHGTGIRINYCFAVPDDYAEEMSRRSGPIARRRFVDALCE